tara:strand:+ start:991 stop:1515 length:525 start_codon:yes stop_codon:yes gene_type:complete
MFYKKNGENIINIIYQKIVEFSRNKIFYTKYKVPDTIDGRFDMLVLITIIVVFRLSKIKNEGPKLSQEIFDVIFRDLDFSLRELGAGDVSVSNNMKKLISSYMGRQKIYLKAFKDNDKDVLALAFKNNIFRNSKLDNDSMLLLSTNILKINKKLYLIENKKILNGEFNFKDYLL